MRHASAMGNPVAELSHGNVSHPCAAIARCVESIIRDHVDESATIQVRSALRRRRLTRA
jgi:hypothetical protein